MKKTYFLIDKATIAKTLIRQELLPNYLTYGAYDAEKDGWEEFWDISIFNVLALPPKSKIFIIDPKYAPIFKLFGHKIILYNINSNHIIYRNTDNLVSIKSIYNSCDLILCVSKTQLKALKTLKLNKNVKIKVLPLGIDSKNFEYAKLRTMCAHIPKENYYLNVGLDAGNFTRFLNEIESMLPIMSYNRSNVLTYKNYVTKLVNCKALVLNRNPKVLYASDISGNTSVLEGLIAKKPVFINKQDWVDEIGSKNIHVYDDVKELNSMLVQSADVWVEEDLKHIEYSEYYSKLKRVLRSLR